MDNHSKPIYITQPLLPDLDLFMQLLEQVWENKILTNNGPLHTDLENKLCDFLGVKHITLVNNATSGLIIALKALDLKGEVITTPFSFVATAHSIIWNSLTPVFVDIDPITLNLNPDRIKAAINENTCAILPVHVFGYPCDFLSIDKIATEFNIKVIYDAAHSFAVKSNGQTILENGDFSVLSFHATKTFNTIEGGAIISKNVELKKKVDVLKNFSFLDETNISGFGINAKLNEIQAAFGILSLKKIELSILNRKKVAILYRKLITSIPGISFLNDIPNVDHNYSYFPIFIDKEKYGFSRDDLHERFKSRNIFTRRYFYPLISNFFPYSGLPSSSSWHLPLSNKIANEVLCLPIYDTLNEEDVERIVNVIKDVK